MGPGRLLLPKAERARDGFPRSVSPFGVTLGGALRRVHYECRLAPLGTQNLEPLSFWASLRPLAADISQRWLVLHDSLL
jgi:hypothetical protein